MWIIWLIHIDHFAHVHLVHGTKGSSWTQCHFSMQSYLLVSSQHSPLQTRPKNNIATPPRRQRAQNSNADSVEVTSPCPKVMYFPQSQQIEVLIVSQRFSFKL